MKRAAIALGLCLLHLAFIALPELQLWQYISWLSQQTKSTEIAFSKKDNSPLTGDITYLNALIDRAKDKQESQKENKIPEISISHTGLIYVVSEASNNEFLHYKAFYGAAIFNKNLLDGVLRILAPPPRFVFA